MYFFLAKWPSVRIAECPLAALAIFRPGQVCELETRVEKVKRKWLQRNRTDAKRSESELASKDAHTSPSHKSFLVLPDNSAGSIDSIALLFC